MRARSLLIVVRGTAIAVIGAVMVVAAAAPVGAAQRAPARPAIESIELAYEGVYDKPTVQGIVLFRGDTGAHQADVNISLRRLASNTKYRLTLNAHACANVSPGGRKVIGVRFTSDAEGEASQTLYNALTNNENITTWTMSIWKGWSGTERRACQKGKLGEVGTTGSNAAWHELVILGDVAALYTGFDSNGHAKDAIYLDLPAAGMPYRVTINSHGCANNAPNQDRMRQFKFTSDQYSEYFQGYTALVENQVVHGAFSMSVYSGWTGHSRLACKAGMFFDIPAELR